jgi:glycosyltransferase involved in cell wall biosynthesis
LPAPESPIRVLRVIARLNMGGPAHHVTLLSGGLRAYGYETLLVHGRVPAGEASLDHLAAERGASARVVETLGPELSPGRDLRALRELVGIVRRFRPHIVHTHTAKAGMLGRLAALAVHPRPIVLHTYHGHVLEGYFGPATSALYRALERLLARVSSRLIGVSHAVVDDLVRLGVASRDRFEVVALGLDLEPLARPDAEARRAFRMQAGATEDDVLLSFVGRLVPIKRVDVLLDAFAQALGEIPALRLAVVGDGPLRAELEARAQRLHVADRVAFLGYRDDMATIVAGADIAVLSSDNEGTPVALIEAGAAGVPAVATAVGGVADVVGVDGGHLVAPDDASAFARALVDLARDPDGRARMGAALQQRVLGRYSVVRLLDDVAALYARLAPSRS